MQISKAINRKNGLLDSKEDFRSKIFKAFDDNDTDILKELNRYHSIVEWLNISKKSSWFWFKRADKIKHHLNNLQEHVISMGIIFIEIAGEVNSINSKLLQELAKPDVDLSINNTNDIFQRYQEEFINIQDRYNIKKNEELDAIYKKFDALMVKIMDEIDLELNDMPGVKV